MGWTRSWHSGPTAPSRCSLATYAKAEVVNQIKSQALIVVYLVLFQLTVLDIPRAKRWQWRSASGESY